MGSGASAWLAERDERVCHQSPRCGSTHEAATGTNDYVTYCPVVDGCPNEAVRLLTRYIKQGSAALQAVDDDPCILLIRGEGGGCILDVAGEAAGVWMPLRGSLHLHNSGLARSAHAKEILTTEFDTHLRVVGYANSRWLAMLGGKQAWAQVLADTSAANSLLLPEKYHASRELRRKVTALARSSSPFELESAVHTVADALAALQMPLHAAIDRCPGHTYAKKRQVFLRLQRVRTFISACCDRTLDNETLARIANYSASHFVRTFNAVYLETPHAYLTRERLKRAARLLHSSNLAVTEVALASGFESRSVFARLFRQHFGTTAREARRRARAVVGG